MLNWFSNEGDNSSPWDFPIGLAILTGFLIIIFYSLSRNDWLNAIAAGMLIASAAATFGLLLGFLFGIPRSNNSQKSNKTDSSTLEIEYSYKVNTNLESISDWLTKILVGVGLVQLEKLPRKLQDITIYAASAFGTPPPPEGLVAAILCYFSIIGFLSGYLWTRLFLTSEFSKAERIARTSSEFHEGVINALLYQPAPDGFTKAIRHGEDFIKHLGSGNWRVWLYLACAYGQQYDFLQRGKRTNSKELEEIRSKALDAVDRVLQLSPETKELLTSLWDQGQVKPTQDDLVVFFNDPEFKKRLG